MPWAPEKSVNLKIQHLIYDLEVFVTNVFLFIKLKDEENRRINTSYITGIKYFNWGSVIFKGYFHCSCYTQFNRAKEITVSLKGAIKI